MLPLREIRTFFHSSLIIGAEITHLVALDSVAPHVNRGLLPPFLIMGLLVASAFASYFAVQSITEGNVREALLEQQKARQIEMIEHVSDQIATDVSATVAILELLAGQPSLQRAEFASAETTSLLEHTHAKLSEINVISTVAILDEDNIIRNNSVEEARRLVGLDRSNQEYVIETRKRMQPYISPAFTSALGENIMALSVPIVHEVTGEYLGLVTTSFPTAAEWVSSVRELRC